MTMRIPILILAMIALTGCTRLIRFETSPVGLETYIWGRDGYGKLGTTPFEWRMSEGGDFNFAFVERRSKRIAYVTLPVDPATTAILPDDNAIKISWCDFNRVSREFIDVDRMILEHEIRIGMSKDEVRKSWGEPSTINTTTTAEGRREQWVYRDRAYNTGLAYFEGDKLVTIQD